MSSPIAAATSQALLMTAGSNAFAQGWTAYQNKSLSTIDPSSFLIFLALAVLVTPPNYLWQKYLEDSFPTHGDTTEKQKLEKGSEQKQKLSITNTAIKFFLDQSIGCWVNTVVFIALMGMFRGKDAATIILNIKKDFWGMVFAGYRLWPMVCLLNLVVVPFEHRGLVGNTAAFGWGVYVALTTT